MNITRTLVTAGLIAAPALALAAESGTFNIRTLTPETALKAAQAALAKCRGDDFQVAVAVVDRMGNVQVVLRDRFAGPHTPQTAMDKGYTAVSFRTDTTELAEATQPGKAASGIRNISRFVGVGGGVKIEGAGSLVGAIGVSGAPSGEADEVCAKAGVAAIREALEF